MRALAFTAFFYAWTTILGLLSVPLLLAPARLLMAYSRFWIRTSFWLLRVTVGLTFEVRGREHMPAEPALYAFKHQSAWDTLAINLLVRDPAIVLKRELTWIPFFGWGLIRSRQIAIDRSGGVSALRAMVKAARARLAEGRSIVIFPEGTRVAPGATRPYHAGIAALQAGLDVPVVPVALNSGLFWPRRSLALRPGVVTVEILPPLPSGLARRAFVAELESRIEDASNRLIGEAAGRFGLPDPNRPVDNIVE